MKLTREQEAILNSAGDIKINAVAGSGKTTTIIEYARTRPAGSKILYLAFNRSVKNEAKIKFENKGLGHVKVETAHSLAYKHVVFKHNYTVRKQGYRTHEIAELLKINGDGEKHTEYVLANHISKFIAYFCNSDKSKVQELNYLDVVADEKARAFVKKFYRYIETQTRVLLQKMDKGEIEITHDFYLKKFHLMGLQLNYDYILFDEAQDASPAMLDLFLKQRAVKVIVGDTHQQIYSWRYAVNSLEKAGFQSFLLSTSFRFSADIAKLANGVLQWKDHLGDHKKISITGKGNEKGLRSKAIIARTNQGLLLKAIEYITEKKNAKRIYFEGNISSYTYADEGASLYDILNLQSGKKALIKDTLIKSMHDISEMEEYIEKTEDKQLGMMMEIVRKYGDEIPGIISKLKRKHIDSDEKEKAEVIFSTVHRCKGMEYDTIQLANDFVSEDGVKKLKAEAEGEALSLSKLNEEINLLYVAVTRTKNTIHIPENLLPEGFPESPYVLPVKAEQKNRSEKVPVYENPKQSASKVAEKAYSVSKLRETKKDAYKPWSGKLDDELTELYCGGATVKEMAAKFGRTNGAIRSRIKKLELPEKYSV